MDKFKMTNELTKTIAEYLINGKIKECINFLDTPENYAHAINLAMKINDRTRAYDLCLKYRDFEFLTFLEKEYYDNVEKEILNIIK